MSKEIGKRNQDFTIKSSIDLEQWQVLTTDIEYGQQILVKEDLGNKKYLASLITNDEKEGISKSLFDGQTIWVILCYLHRGEFASSGAPELPDRNSLTELKLMLV